MSKSENAKLRLNLTASRVGAYFEKMCERNLLVESVKKSDLERVLGVTDQRKQDSSDAWAGDRWEETVLARLQEEEKDHTIRVLCNEEDEKKKFTYEKTIAALQSLDLSNPLTTYLFQACVSVEENSSFYQKYIEEKGYTDCGVELTFGDRMYPDFLLAEYIESEKKYRITVIDVKGADHLKVNAQVQIGLYALMLKHIIEDKKIATCYVNEENGIVWNKEPITKRRLDHAFSLKEAFAEIENFFDVILKGICEKLATAAMDKNDSNNSDSKDYIGALSCMVSAQCEYCSAYETCVERLKQGQNVRLLPYMSRLAQEKLNALMEDGTPGAPESETLSEIVSYLQSADSSGLTENCNFWKKVRNDLEPSADGFRDFCVYGEEANTVFYKQGSTLGFPTYQDFALFLTAQRDVDSGRCYAYAWYLKCGYGLDPFEIGLNENGFADERYSHDEKKGEGTYYGALIAKNNILNEENGKAEEFDRIDKAFVEILYEIFVRIAKLKEKTLQIYVMSAYERQNLERALYHILETFDPVTNQDFMEKVMTILFWLQSEQLAASSSNLPTDIVDNPVTVLSSEVQKLYVLPQGIAYNLKSISKLLSPDFNFEDNVNDPYFEKLSDVMSGMPFVRICEMAQQEDKKEKAEKQIKSMYAHLIMRMRVESAIVDRIHRDSKNGLIHLSNRAGVYTQPAVIRHGYAELNRLSFENRYEELLKYHQTRSVRMNGIDHAIEEGNILLLEYLGSDRYLVHNYDRFDGNEWFSSVICEDTEANRQSIPRFTDIFYKEDWRSNCFKARNNEGELVPVFYPVDFGVDFDFKDSDRGVTMHYRVRKGSDFEPKVGHLYLLFERYTDFNSKKTEAGLRSLEERIHLLRPRELACDMDVQWSSEAEAVCSKYWSPDGLSFSPSQKEAFIHLFNRNLTVLVGPPAAGKTNFIGRAVLTLGNYYKEKENRDMRVLVSANSHSAIENVLIEIAEMQSAAPDSFASVAVNKVKEIKEHDEILLNYVTVVKEDMLDYTLDNEEDCISVTGSTCWSMYKTGKIPFDLVIIDEASQLRAMDAALILNNSNENTRFLLVGDDNQLPPIIGGAYPEPEDTNEAYIHGSIFTLYLTALGNGHPDIIQLNDNFRMNDVLCRYCAREIYGPNYHAPTYIPSIGSQKIKLQKQPADEILKFMLDEEYPLVFCKLSGVSSEQRKAEVELAALLVKELWDNDLNPDGSLSHLGNFWEKKAVNGRIQDGACGIISPHHEHIKLLRGEIARAVGCPESEVYIGTVDRLQGKERRNIIVSYGVYDKETIENECEFIFSLNRFNVSLTRGKAKTIVFLSDVIVDSSLITNNLMGRSEDAKRGIEFVQGFGDYMMKAQADEDLQSTEFTYMEGNVRLEIWKKKLI